jgi:hypothetical protein
MAADEEDEEDGPLEPFANCRKIMRGLIGRTLLEITGADEEDPEAFVCFMFDDGSMLTMRSGDGAAMPFSLEGPAVEMIEGEE